MKLKQLFACLPLLAAAAMLTATTAHAAADGVKITEWMYNGSGSSGFGEFVEITNFGPTAIDFTGWSFDDSSRIAGSQSLSLFGLVGAGESVIFTDLNASDFRTAWGLSSTVKIVGGNTNNLGRSDEINIYNAANTLVDRLTYNDADGAGPRTVGISANPLSAAAIGANNDALWAFSVVGGVEGSITSSSVGTYAGGDIGNPGHTSYAPAVPVPAALPLMMSALGLLGGARRLRSKK